MENLHHTGRINKVFEDIKKKYNVKEDEVLFKSYSYEEAAKNIFSFLKANFSFDTDVKELIEELEKEAYNG